MRQIDQRGGAVSGITLSNISKSFGALAVFKNFSLTCEAHQYLCLVGPSGCGKSTLIRLVAGLEQPDAGDIMIDGRRVNELAPAQRNVGLAFQNYALYPHLTVSGNLAFPLRAPSRKKLYGTISVERRVREIAGLLQIDELLERSVDQLSGGQQQRVALGRALISNPRVLLLDEPLAHLDARLRHRTRAELKQLHQRIGTTTLHVTHDQLEALSIADMIAVIKEGVLQQFGTPLELYTQPCNTFVATFIGDPPMSLLRAAVTSERGISAIRVGDVELPLPAELAWSAGTANVTKEVWLGLRPSQIRLAGETDAAVFEGVVYSHESIGRQVEVTVMIGASRLRYRSETIHKWRVGQKLPIAISLDGAKLFDGKTGRAIR